MEQNLQIIFALAVLLFIPSIQALVFSNGNFLNTLVRNEELPTATVIIQAKTDVQVNSFEITGTAATYFAINNTGYIYIKQRIDREELSSSRITGDVKAKKDSTTATAPFACVINDINDNVPSYHKRLYEVSVSEATPFGSAIFSTKAVDGDENQHGTILYGIASGNETGKFSISLYGGEVTLASHLDYETNKEYTLNITVKDVPGLSNWTILLVHVVDADDLPAKFTAYSYSASIREDATSGAPVTQVKAYDLDQGINGTVKYAIDQDSNPSRLFVIDDKTGEISLNGSLDRETGDEYIIRVLASSSFPVGDHATVTIKVTDVNDNKPMLSQSTYNATVAENMASGTFVVQITATDKDEGINAKLRYSIQIGVDSNRFSIDYQTGKISTAVKLDREKKDSYTLIVLVEDMDGNSTIGTVYNDTATVYISVKDLNDNAPVFSNSTYTITINESLAIGSPVIQVEAKDADVEQNTLYSISAGNELSRFVIGPNSGMISIETLIDRDTPNHEREFHLQVTATDKKNAALKSTANVTITIDDVNDNKPSCSQDQYSSNVLENTTIDSIVASLNCTDLDSGENGRLTYNLTSGADGKFAINSTTGIVKTADVLDYESKTSYVIKVEIQDHGQPQLSIEIAVEIKVININDNTPQFSKQNYEFSILEGDYSGNPVVVGKVEGTDKDTDSSGCLCGELRYSIVNTTGIFTIDATSGYIRTSNAFDREKTSNYTLVVKVTDLDPSNPLSNTSDVIIHVIDVNDNSPVFSKSIYGVNISEAAAQGDNVIKVTATDRDAGSNANITYTIESGNVANGFTIDTRSGQIKVTGPLDKETRSKYELIIAAIDAGKSKRKSTVVVTIDIIDVNDNKPVLSQSTYNATVTENMASGTFVVQITATDKDEGINAKLRYSIQDGLNSDRFSIDYQTGKISTAVKLDREEIDSYTLIVLVEDMDGNRTIGTVYNDTATVYISVKDLNDNAPVFSNSTYTITINESLAIGSPVIQVEAKDADVEQNIVYSISAGNELSRFVIGPDRGMISIETLIDRDSPKHEREFHLQVTASDEKNAATANVTIFIDDVNDNKPSCSQDQYSLNVQENTTIDSFVASLTCTDLDSGENGRLSYNLTSGADGKFAINSTTGIVKTADVLDYESKTSYVIKVKIQDHGQPQLSIEITVEIKVVNINDNTPQFSKQNYEFSIFEGDYSGHPVVVGKVKATDKDADSSGCLCGELRYSIVNNTDFFTINQVSGYIRSSKTFDREKKSNYTLVVKVTDLDPSNPLSNTSDVIIHVIDVNDNSPVFSKSIYGVNISEAAAKGDSVIKVTATDRDAGSNANITYTIESGNVGDGFKIDARSGQIKVDGPLDKETRSRYELIVAAIDAGKSQRKTTVVVTINIIDANDHDPVCAQKNVVVKIKENLAPGQIVTTVIIVDQDKDIKETTIYSLQSDSFAVNPSTGVVNTTVKLDREKQSEYSLSIQAYYFNQSSKALNCSVRVIVEDQNDNPPVFNVSTKSLNVIENSTVGTTLLRVTATDDDAGYNGEIIYSFIGDGTKFAINGTTGVLTLISSLDRETMSQYIIRVFATDRGLPQSLSSTLVLTINVTDVNDNDPVFTQKVYSAEVAENSVNTSVLTVIANDKDEGLNGNIVYSIKAGNSGNAFAIMSNGTIVTAIPLDRETKGLYGLTIVATDQGVPARSASVQAIITVSDVNDNPPNITNAPTNITIPENTPIGLPVFSLLSEDKDVGVNAKIEYTGFAEPAGAFAIDQSTGTIKVIGQLDREKINSYKFHAVARDTGSPSLNSTVVQFDIIIDDVNDNNPVFNPVSYTANVSEGQSPGVVVTKVNATEKDKGDSGRIAYKIESGDSNGDFGIDNSTGVITTRKVLDRESIAKYSLVIAAMDHGKPPRLGYAYVTVNVIDSNDLPPVFTLNEYYTTVKEDVIAGTAVVRVTATDGDLGTNAKITYSLVSGDGMNDFNITTESVPQSGSQSKRYIGRIETARGLDRESRDRYNLTVMASDGKHNVSTQVIITLQDVNDNEPIFNMTGQLTNITIKENTPGGTSVLQVRAYDKDVGINAKITYSLQGDSDSFYVDSSGGLLYTSSKPLDRETKDFYNLTITATDSGNNKAYLSITIHVSDVNDNVPKFNQSSYTVDVGEGSVVYDVTATDDDLGANQEIRYSIVYGNDEGLFHIDNTTGRLTSTRPIDREGPGHKLDQNGRVIYLLGVEAADQGNPKLSSTANVIIRVTDINDNKPVFLQSSYGFTAVENVSLGYTVGSVAAKDKDYGDNANIVYSILTQDIPFLINSSSGVLTVNGSLDREKVSSYKLTVKASDKDSPSKSSTVLVTITIDDVNDNKPTFNQSTYHVTLPENTLGGHVIMTLNAEDADEGKNAEIKFKMVDGSSDKFSVSEFSGIVRTVGNLDYETSQSYTLNVSVTDRGDPPLQSFALVYINITDYNDNPPVFNESNLIVNVSESVAINSTITVARATDIDSGNNGKISYSLVVDGDGTFAIKNAGEIINLKPLDYEQRTSYKLQVKATDGGNNPLSSMLLVTVNVVDVNDNTPEFPQSYYFNVNVDALSGRLIGSVQARDRDSGLNGRLKYTLNNRKDIFKINKDDGDLSLVSSVSSLANQNLTLSVTCQDSGSPPLAANGTVYVYIGAGVRYTTRLIPRHINVSIYENETVGFLVATLNASKTFGIEYKLLEEDHGKFGLNSSTGEIKLVSSLDREKKLLYKIFVAVQDISERLNSDYGTVTVTVLDINDNAPAFIQTPVVLPISENSPNGTFVTRVQASDPDEGVNKQIFYHIEGDASSTFNITNDTGVITTKASLDFETHPVYNITVVAENSLSPIRMRTSVSFDIPIKDVLDYMPRFTSSVYRASVREDVALGSAVIDMNATTHDQYSRYIVYRIVHNESSENSYHFSIDPESGILRTQNSLDRETTSNYTLAVEARDIRDPLNYKAITKVVVTVTDVNDNSPVFTNKTFSFSPSESSRVGDVIGRVQAVDKDAGENSGIDYEIISGNELGYCGINSTTGDIYIAKPLDYETVSSITMTIRAYDRLKSRRTRRDVSGAAYNDVTVTIAIKDVNDNLPTFTQTFVLGWFYPEDPDNKVVATVKATDKDSGTGGVIKYSAVNQSHPGTLIINTQIGQLTRVQSLAPLSVLSYSMVVTAKDNNGQLPYNTASNPATAIDHSSVIKTMHLEFNELQQFLSASDQPFQMDNVLQLTANTSITIAVGLPLSLVQQNKDLLISLLRNITGKDVVVKSLQKSPDDPETTLAVIHLIDNQTRSVLTRDQANRIFTDKSKELDDLFPEWKIRVHSKINDPPEVSARTAYFSAYIGALVAFAVLIGIVGLCAILVVCRYKYREKHIEAFEPDEKHGLANGSEIPWTAVDYPQIGAYIESRADNPRLKTRHKGQMYQPNNNGDIIMIDVGPETSTSTSVPNDAEALLESDEPILILQARDNNNDNPTHSTTTSLQGPNTRTTALTTNDDKHANDNAGFEGATTSSLHNNIDDNPERIENSSGGSQKRTILSMNPFSKFSSTKSAISPRDHGLLSTQPEQTSIPKNLTSEEQRALFSPKSYSPRDMTIKAKVGDLSDQYDVYDAHRVLEREDSSAKNPRVRFDLEEDRNTDELEWERQESNPMPDILTTSKGRYDVMLQELSHNESKTDDSPASSVTDDEHCEVWDLEDDHGFIPLHNENIDRYDVNPRYPLTKFIDNDIEVTSL